MKKIMGFLALISSGAFFYGGFEIVGRGYTHISMGLLGGIALCVIHLLNSDDNHLQLPVNAAVSALFITSCEFCTGEILNNCLGMHIWDYSDLPFNFDGQICVLFSLLWYMLSLVGIMLDLLIRHKIFCERYVPQNVNNILFNTQPL